MELGGALWPTLTESPSKVITSFLTKEYPHQFQELRKPSCQRAPTLRWASQLFPRLTHGPSSLQGSAQVDLGKSTGVGLPFTSLGDLPDSGIKPVSPAL